MKIIGGGGNAGVVIESFDAPGFHMDYVIDDLQFAFDDQKCILSKHETLRFEEFGGDDGVADAGFVFEADKNNSAGGSRPLSANDVSGDANDAAGFCFR